ncbi:hypothetical protein D3C81_1338970 [compost metagenome]
MALHTHEVGVLARFAPVQRILEAHALARIQVKPAVLLGIPGHAQGLQAAFTDFDQVLLQRRDTEGVGHLEVGVLAVGARGIDPEASVLAKEPGRLVLALEGAVLEVGQHGLLVGDLHRQLVMGALPVLDLLGVASLALLLVDHASRRQRGRDRGGRSHGHARRYIGRWRRFAGEQEPAEARHDQQQQAGSDGKQVAGNQGRWRIRVRCNRIFLMLGHYDFRSPEALAIKAGFLCCRAALLHRVSLSNDACDRSYSCL